MPARPPRPEAILYATDTKGRPLEVTRIRKLPSTETGKRPGAILYEQGLFVPTDKARRVYVKVEGVLHLNEDKTRGEWLGEGVARIPE